MGDPESKLDLTDRLIGIFKRVVGAEMPTRALVFPKSTVNRSRSSSSGIEKWGSHPVALLAVNDAVVLRVGGRDSIRLRAGEALLMSARDLLALKPGGQGTMIGFETLGTQPCRFFEVDAVDPWERRRDLELFCMPFADDLPGSWKACHEIHCLLESAQRYASATAEPEDQALRSVLRLATIECGRALEDFRAAVVAPVKKSNAARVAAAEVFVSCYIQRDIRKSELADRLGVSVSQLTLAFREIGQLAVRDRIRFRRVESARNLLADTTLSVSEIAERVGMNYRHFIRAFRQSALLTPLRYRKYARKDSKPPQVLEEFLHTANFDRVEPLVSLNGERSNPVRNSKDGAVSVLVSNASREPVVVSRLAGDGAFVDLGIVGGEKRLSFLDSPGSVWKIERRGGDSSQGPGGGGAPLFFESGKTNSHFIFEHGLSDGSTTPC